MKNEHGGARQGAGRKPKAMIYAEPVQAVEQKMVDAMPDIVDKLIDMAKGGDLGAAKYLIDHVLGRVPRLESPPAEDRTLPYSEEDLEMDAGYHERKVDRFREDQGEWLDELSEEEPPAPVIIGLTREAFHAGQYPPEFSVLDQIKLELARRGVLAEREQMKAERSANGPPASNGAYNHSA